MIKYKYQLCAENKVSNLLRPTHVSGPVSNIETFSFLEAMPEIEGITWDLDRTLTGHREPELPQAHLDVMKSFSELGLAQAIISNARSKKRSNRVLEVAGSIGSYIGADVTVVTSRQLDGHSKPGKIPYEKAAELMDIPPVRLCHIGDQIFKDVLGANRAGYGASVILPPFGPSKEGFGVKYAQRPVEMFLRPLMGAPIRYRNFGRKSPSRSSSPRPLPLREASEYAA